MHNPLAFLEERTHAGAWSLDVDTRVVSWSVGVHRIHGTDPDRFVPKLDECIRFYSEESRARLETALEDAIRDHKEYALRAELCRVDGKVAKVFVVGRPDFKNGQLYKVSGVLYDIGAIEGEKIAAAESEDRFRMLVRDAPNGLLLANPAKQIILVNPALCSMLGYEEAELLAKTTTEITHFEDRQLSSDVVRRLWADETSHLSYEKRYLRKDGSAVWIHISLSLFRGADGTPLHFIGQCEDISERKREADELFEANELAQITLSSIADGVIRTNEKGTITFCNAAAVKILGSHCVDIVGKTFVDVVALHTPTGEGRLEDPVQLTLATGLAMKIPPFTRLKTSDGGFRPIFDSTAPVRDREGCIVGTVFVFQDATENMQMAEQLRFQANHDSLTGLPNRQAAEENIAFLIEQLPVGEKKSFLFYMDLDHFNIINDTCGHHAGDHVIREISLLIASTLREGDFLARIGGDEFVLVLEDITPEQTILLARRICDAVAAYRFEHGAIAYVVSVSIGIVQLGQAGKLQDALAQADAACYAAKRSGRGTYQIYTAEDERITESQGDLGWFQQIRRILGEKDSQSGEHFALYFQAIVGRDRQILGSEALIRFVDSKGAVLSPDRFLPAAERMGILGLIDRWVCKKAIVALRAMQQVPAVGQQIGKFLSINVSAQSFSSAGFCTELLELLDRNLDVSAALRIEITETERARWAATEIEILRQIRLRNVRIVLDDFGSGYNSFHVLKLLKIDGIKLDQNVVGGLLDNLVDQSLATAAIGIAAKLGIFVTAEGVEDERRFELLRDLGVQHFQGYLFQRPSAVLIPSMDVHVQDATERVPTAAP